MRLIRPIIRTLGAAAFVALVATSLPHLSARADVPAVVTGPAIDPANFDPTCKPCDDFFQFATGGWEKTHTIPAGHARWGGFDELLQHNRDVLHGILDAAAKNTSAPAGSDEQKIGAFYRSCMDTDRIEAAGLGPVQPLLDTVAAVKDQQTLSAAIATLQAAGVNAGLPLGAQPDRYDSSKQIASIGFGGLGMPERTYYLSDKDKYPRFRTAYREYVAKQFENLGDPAATAQSEADGVVALETALAKATPERSAMRSPLATYHPTPVAQLHAIAPHFGWQAYAAAYRAPSTLATVNVALPDFVTAYDAQIAGLPLSTWKNYLRYHVIDAYAPTLPKRFDDASYAFHTGVLLNVTQQPPRWETCVARTDQSLRDVLGRVYVATAFPPAAKARAVAMVNNLQSTLRADIMTLSWMSPATKQQAVVKLDAYTKKIGYPDVWQDYSALTVTDAPLATNAIAVARWNDARDIARIGTKTDRTRWGMTPPTVNAYYNPGNNEIVFPAGILGGVFFNPNADDAVNYGGIGAVIGHEMTHGFDDQGRQYDAQGNLRDWWTPADAAAFKSRAQCIVDQFSSYEVLPGVHMNGTNVQGEAIADLGGLTIAYKAFEKTPEFKAGKKIDGYTPAQRFFLAYAQIWRALQTDGLTRQLAVVDPHPNFKYRIIGTLSNMPEFRAAFGCVAGDKMVRANACQIW